MVLGFNADATLLWGWQPEPDRRGTWSILSSCLATLLLCIWSALHLNLPRYEDRWWDISRRKALWLICGLFAPEVVVWVAYVQFRAARILTVKMRKALGEVEPESRTTHVSGAAGDIERGAAEAPPNHTESKPPGRLHPWTIVHSHYALMGGFAIDSKLSFRPSPSSPSENTLPCGLRRLALTLEGVERLVFISQSLLPDLSQEQILDKSKANGLAKTIVCLQASWFVLQCVVRLSQGLSISLLEVNTFAHALCALLIFLLWWNKPLDITQPTILQLPRELCAAFALTAGTTDFYFDYPTKTDRRGELNQNQLYYKEKAEGPHGNRFSEETMTELFRLSLRSQSRQITTTKGPQARDDGSFLIARKDRLSLTDGKCVVSCRFRVEVEQRPVRLTLDDVAFLELACRGALKHRGLLQNQIYPSVLARSVVSTTPTTSDSDIPLYFGFVAAGLAYGAIHLVAWSAPFTTTAELMLWRASGIFLMASGLIVCAIPVAEFCDTCVARYPQLKQHILLKMGKKLLGWIVVAFYCCFALCYVVARVYLVVECFMELAHLPEQTYLMPKWARYWPHIG